MGGPRDLYTQLYRNSQVTVGLNVWRASEYDLCSSVGLNKWVSFRISIVRNLKNTTGNYSDPKPE